MVNNGTSAEYFVLANTKFHGYQKSFWFKICSIKYFKIAIWKRFNLYNLNIHATRTHIRSVEFYLPTPYPWLRDMLIFNWTSYRWSLKSVNKIHSADSNNTNNQPAKQNKTSIPFHFKHREKDKEFNLSLRFAYLRAARINIILYAYA